MNEKLLLAKTLTKTEPDEALRLCNQVMNEDFDGVDGQMALFIAAYIFLEAERYGLAYQMYKRCAELNPNISEIYSNMGMCLEEHDPYKAQRMFQKAAQLKPDNPNAYANEALICLQMAKPQKCIDLCNKALEIDPNSRTAKHNRGLGCLMLREWEKGWADYYDTLGVKHREKRDYGLPDWEGQKGTIIVYGEQGVGDEIMFASCLPELIKTNEVILDTDSRLKSLFERTFNIPTYGTRFESETPLMDEHEADYQLAIGQLPFFYRRSEEDFSGDPYLVADPEQEIMWGALFDTFPGRQIGIAWSGGLPNTGQKKRTLELEDFEPLFNDQDTFISLEYKPVDKTILEGYGIKAYPEVTGKGQSIDKLAAMISQLDVVVSACTTVIYIAGALGVPCVCLVPREPSYRYHLTGQFPWFDSIRLIRQQGSWRDTVKRAKKYIE